MWKRRRSHFRSCPFPGNDRCPPSFLLIHIFRSRGHKNVRNWITTNTTKCEEQVQQDTTSTTTTTPTKSRGRFGFISSWWRGKKKKKDDNEETEAMEAASRHPIGKVALTSWCNLVLESLMGMKVHLKVWGSGDCSLIVVESLRDWFKIQWTI